MRTIHSILVLASLLTCQANGWITTTTNACHSCPQQLCSLTRFATATGAAAAAAGGTKAGEVNVDDDDDENKRVVIVGAGWAGLSAAQALMSSNSTTKVTLIEASPRVGGLVRDGFTTLNQTRAAEAGQHGFWCNYRNIYRLLEDLDLRNALTDFAEQGQYSPNGLEAIWPVYRDQPVTLPTGLAQAAYTRFLRLPMTDLLSAWPLVVAFSEFDDSARVWEKYDEMSFRDLCLRLGVSKRCYDEAFEPMILTGLFAPGAECSAAAALGMAYFFVLQSQTAFDVQWCRGNIGSVIFDPWIHRLKEGGVEILCNTRVAGFEFDGARIRRLCALRGVNETMAQLEADDVVLAVGAKALNGFSRFCPELSKYKEFRGFANLRGTSVLATRIFLDHAIEIPYSANACWGFDDGVGMTVFDITTLHGSNASTVAGTPGSVIEVDFYHASSLLSMSDADIVTKAKTHLNTMFGQHCKRATVVDAAVVRLPNAVNWYFPGSYKDMPDLKSSEIENLFFCGDIARSRHGSWSQEKAFVSGMEAANLVLGKPIDSGILPVAADEAHVKFGRHTVSLFQNLVSEMTKRSLPSLADFLS